MSLEEQIEAAYTWTIKGQDVTHELLTHIDFPAIKKAFKDDGWVRIPGSQNKNVTIFTHDSENERFMTFDEWAEEATKQGWSKTSGQA